jgi:hypothetical protein
MVAVSLIVSLIVPLPMPFVISAAMTAAMTAVPRVPGTGAPGTAPTTTSAVAAAMAATVTIAAVTTPAAAASLPSPTTVIPTRRRRCRRTRIPARIATPINDFRQRRQLEVHPEILARDGHERLDQLITLLLAQPGMHAGTAELIRGRAARIYRGAGQLTHEPELDLTSDHRTPQPVLHLHHQRIGYG